MNLDGARVLVTGGAGFLGRHVCRRLAEAGAAQVFVPRSARYDLRTEAGVERAFQDSRPGVVIHAAGAVGGIGLNRADPGRLLRDNALMGLHVVDAARRHGVQKLVNIGTVCSYPKHAAIPFREDDIWSGYPEETNAPFGLAKKLVMVQAQTYRAQYGLNAITLLAVNLYGPEDNFEPETSHVIPALIRRAVAARRAHAATLSVWGSGSATREFLHVRDAAAGVVAATQRYDGDDPVNLGSGEEVSIRHLAERICTQVRFSGGIEFDSSHPDGQPRRRLDVSRAKAAFGFSAGILLEAGLRETIDWYEAQAHATSN